MSGNGKCAKCDNELNNYFKWTCSCCGREFCDFCRPTGGRCEDCEKEINKD